MTVKYENKPGTNIHHKVLIAFFFSFGQISQNHPDKTFKQVLFGCWLFVCFFETKMTTQFTRFL